MSCVQDTAQSAVKNFKITVHRMNSLQHLARTPAMWSRRLLEKFLGTVEQPPFSQQRTDSIAGEKIMGLLSKIFGDGTFESTNRNFKSDDESTASSHSSSAGRSDNTLRGPMRYWTPRQQATCLDGVGYHDVGAVYINPSLSDIDAHFGWPTRHLWDSIEPDEPITARKVEKILRHAMDTEFHRENDSRLILEPALRPYFDDKGNFIGDNPDMVFKVEGARDQTTDWMAKECGY